MNAIADAWLCAVLLALFAGRFLLLLRVPNPSRTLDNAVLAATAVLFFGILGIIVNRHQPAQQQRSAVASAPVVNRLGH